jgi:hypothetical protein
MRSPCCLCVCVSPISTFESLNRSLWNLVCIVYHGTWAHLNDVLHKSFSSVSVSACTSPLSLLGNGLVDTLPWQRIHATEQLLEASFSIRHVSYQRSVCGSDCVSLPLLGNGSVNTFPRQRGIVGGLVFYAVLVVSKESRRLLLTRASCFSK